MFQLLLKYTCTVSLQCQIYFLSHKSKNYTEGECTNKKYYFPCKARQVQSRCSPSWQTSLCTTKNVFVGIMEGGSPAMSAGANPVIFGPISPSCMHKCILLLVLRFLCFLFMRKLKGHFNRSIKTLSVFISLCFISTCKEPVFVLMGWSQFL
jgi:hypothetical protein